MDSPIERMCKHCNEPLPEGTLGQFCSHEHEWLNKRKGEQGEFDLVTAIDPDTQYNTRTIFAP